MGKREEQEWRHIGKRRDHICIKESKRRGEIRLMGNGVLVSFGSLNGAHSHCSYPSQSLLVEAAMSLLILAAQVLAFSTCFKLEL